jgi:hypothetical protein
MSVLALGIGLFLALAVGLMATLVGLDRERSFYPTVTIVVASYYVLYAVLGGSTHAMLIESVLFYVFWALAVWSFRSSLWIAAAALAAHGIFDFAHDALVFNPGMPSWCPSFCAGYDIAAAAYCACVLAVGRARARAT